MIQEKMKTSQSRQKSYHDKRRKDLEFQEGDNVFLRVTPITGVGRALKSKKLTPKLLVRIRYRKESERWRTEWVYHRIYQICMMCFMCHN
jgi:hypothetical protein